MKEGLNDRGMNKMGLGERGLNQMVWKSGTPEEVYTQTYVRPHTGWFVAHFEAAYSNINKIGSNF